MHSPMRGDMQRVPWSADLRSRLMPLFDAPPPVPVRLWAIMDGAAPGRILVDDPQRPSCALIQELAEGTAYLGGRADSAWVHAGVDLLRREQDVVVCLWPDDPRASSLPPAPDYVGEAVDFTERGPADAVVLPDGYTLRTIDADVVPRLRGFDYYVAMFGSVTQALAGTVGSCVLWQDAVVSEAVAGPFARGLAEIGVGTEAAHQGKGLATAVAARVIGACEERGFQPFWNAAAQNSASVALARRLGFRHARTALVYAWSGVRRVAMGVAEGR